jgi:acetyl-CoA carboxylase biotin carboxylase subunit
LPQINKILIANRAEIACRIIKTAKLLGIKTVAIYSTIDRNAPHVLTADEAFHIGANPSNESYLLAGKIIEIALANNVDAIHPGYGFLSENAKFAEDVKKAGLIFIGPDPKAIRIMGDKLAAKDAISQFEIPKVPGTDKPVEDISQIKEFAKNIGFPILIKAAAGGGGKGMRLVEKEEDLEEQLKRASSEALSSFGNGAVFIEKYIRSPRHIEIQVLADRHGNIVHLFERECSIQRRHQKIIEEAPSCILNSALRDKMGEAAIQVAKACQYIGAGTVEFMVDENLDFYFLEMNTRLQVEHPVSELITGIDLVAQQIFVAEGKKLTFNQNDLSINGHAIELRVYAEDPENKFTPSIGILEQYNEPDSKGVRVDSGYKEKMEIPIYYDPMLSKLIVYAPDRIQAIQLMRKAIKNYIIKGVKTTLPFGEYVMKHERFISGNFNTHFVDEHYYKDFDKPLSAEWKQIAAAIAVVHRNKIKKQLRRPIA